MRIRIEKQSEYIEIYTRKMVYHITNHPHESRKHLYVKRKMDTRIGNKWRQIARGLEFYGKKRIHPFVKNYYIALVLSG